MTPEVRAGLEAALAHGGETHTIEDVLRMVERHEAQWWETDRAVIITEIDGAPRAKVLRFWLATGELEEVIALSRGVLEWGKRIGCTQATFAGRRGWEKVLGAEGWSPKLIVMTREI